ncbi:MAG: NAD-dependent epimerase/dehydratase family protein [Pseudomonadota bacterium]
MSSRRVSLFGASGFVGRSIAARLDELGVDWIGFSRRGECANCVAMLDLSAEEIAQRVSCYPLVINAMGSLKPRDFSDDLPLALEEFWSTIQRFSAILAASRIDRLVHISSAGAVYGDNTKGVEHREGDALHPGTWYGRAKAMEEGFLYQMMHQGGVSYACARVSNPYGNMGALNHGFLDVLVGAVLGGKVFQARFPGRATRDFIYAPVMARMLVDLALSDNQGIFNIGSGQATRLADVLDLVEQVVPDAKIERLHPDMRADIAVSLLCVDKYKRHFGDEHFSCMTPFEYVRNGLVDLDKTKWES